VYGAGHDNRLREETVSNCRDMVAFLNGRCSSGLKVKLAFVIPWGEDHWRMRPPLYDIMFDCWRGCRNLLKEEFEVEVQADASYLDTFVEILVRFSFIFSSSLEFHLKQNYP
jgi:hypothetical protein